jgi:hypothetical protein
VLHIQSIEHLRFHLTLKQRVALKDRSSKSLRSFRRNLAIVSRCKASRRTFFDASCPSNSLHVGLGSFQLETSAMIYPRISELLCSQKPFMPDNTVENQKISTLRPSSPSLRVTCSGQWIGVLWMIPRTSLVVEANEVVRVDGSYLRLATSSEKSRDGSRVSLYAVIPLAWAFSTTLDVAASS